MSRESFPIILCCAEETEVDLVAVVDALHKEGYAPEVLPGLERDADLLASAADRVRGRALFVLCQSDDLDRFQVRRLQGLFSARKGPEHQMITVDVQAMGAMAVLPEVRVAARGSDDGGGAEQDGQLMRDVVVTSTMTAPGASIPDRPRRRKKNVGPGAEIQEPMGISAEALGMSPEEAEEVVPPRKLFPEPDVLIATDPTGQTVSPFDGMRFDGIPGMPGMPEAPEAEEAPEEPVVSPRPIDWGGSAPIEVNRVSSQSIHIDPRAEADAAPLPSMGEPAHEDEDEERDAPADEPAPERRRSRIGLLLFAGAGMTAVVVMAVLHGTAPVGLGPEGGQKVERGLPPARDSAGNKGEASAGAGNKASVAVGESGAQPAETTASAGSTAAAAPEPGGTSGGASEGGGDSGDADGASTVGDSSGGDEPSTTSGSEPSTTTGAEPATSGDAGATPSPTGSKSVPPPPTAGSPANELDAVIEAALAEGRLSEMDGLLVSRGGPSTMTWDDANTRCRRRKVDGITRWRLPSKGQLSKIHKAKLVSSGSYWSKSEVGGDEVYALDAKSGRLNVWLKIEPNARALCVRKRP